MCFLCSFHDSEGQGMFITTDNCNFSAVVNKTLSLTKQGFLIKILNQNHKSLLEEFFKCGLLWGYIGFVLLAKVKRMKYNSFKIEVFVLNNWQCHCLQRLGLHYNLIKMYLVSLDYPFLNSGDIKYCTSWGHQTCFLRISLSKIVIKTGKISVSIKEWLDNLRKDVGKHAALIKMLWL